MIPSHIDKVVAGDAVLFRGDCKEVWSRFLMLTTRDWIITDPPYPEQKGVVADYEQCDIEWLDAIDCRQLIFWPADVPFPLDYTAIHIWDKRRGVQSSYERIFERHGNKLFKVFSHQSIISKLTAQFACDTYYGHPSQKPASLMMEIIAYVCKQGGTIFDPYMGVGSTGEAALKLGRKFVGVEIDEAFFRIAVDRISAEANQTKMF